MAQFQDIKADSNKSMWIRLAVYFVSISLIIQVLICSSLLNDHDINYRLSMQLAFLGLAILVILSIASIVLRIKNKASIFECLLYWITLIVVIGYFLYLLGNQRERLSKSIMQFDNTILKYRFMEVFT